MNAAEIPPRERWKQDLSPYIEVDERRSLGQIASVVLPYLAVPKPTRALQPITQAASATFVATTLSRIFGVIPF